MTGATTPKFDLTITGFGPPARDLREARGITREAVAATMDVDVAAVQKFEWGQPTGFSFITQYCIAIGTTAHEALDHVMAEMKKLNIPSPMYDRIKAAGKKSDA